MRPYHLVPPLLLFLSATGCTLEHQATLPEQDPPLVAATRLEDPPPAPPGVDVPVSLPLPAQLPPLPPHASPAKAKGLKTPQNVIAQAHQGATQGPTTDGYINAVQVYTFAPGALYQLYTRPETVSDLTLQAGETLIATAAGDTARWVVGDTTSGAGEGQQVHVLVKPIKEGLQTNLLITTDRHVYHLECHSTSGTYMAAVSWQYPADDLARLTRASLARKAQEQQVVAPLLGDATTLNFGYHIDAPAHPRWTPTRVFDDGQKTFIQFPQALTTSEAPALFLTSREGATQLVNYRVKGTWYIVDRLFDRAELRVGEQDPTVVRLTRQGR
jgi:type IV secretion system protein TrbG